MPKYGGRNSLVQRFSPPGPKRPDLWRAKNSPMRRLLSRITPVAADQQRGRRVWTPEPNSGPPPDRWAPGPARPRTGDSCPGSDNEGKGQSGADDRKKAPTSRRSPGGSCRTGQERDAAAKRQRRTARSGLILPPVLPRERRSSPHIQPQYLAVA